MGDDASTTMLGSLRCIVGIIIVVKMELVLDFFGGGLVGKSALMGPILRLALY